MHPQNHDWTYFKRQIFIKAECAEVFKAWTTAKGITAWFIAEAQYTTVNGQHRALDEQIQSGDQYYWRWHQDLETQGEILEVQPNTRLCFTFGNKGDGSDEKVIVTVSFTELDNETMIELHQDNMPTSDDDKRRWYLGCNMGWSFFMTNLKALLEYGADLREYEADRAYSSRAISL